MSTLTITIPSSKLLSFSTLNALSSSLHAKQKKIVLTTGVFDLFHRAHDTFLKKAKHQGDFLLVGLETDERVRQLKGEGRPKETLETRLQKVAAHPSVNAVFALPAEFDKPEHHQHLIKILQPDIFAVSAHSPHQDKKRAIVETFGGKLVVVMDQDKTISTSQIIRSKIINHRG